MYIYTTMLTLAECNMEYNETHTRRLNNVTREYRATIYTRTRTHTHTRTHANTPAYTNNKLLKFMKNKN